MLTIDLDSLVLDLHVGSGKLVLSRYKVNLACGTLSLKDSVPGSLNPQSILAILAENVTPTAAFNAPVIKGEGNVICTHHTPTYLPNLQTFQDFRNLEKR